MPAEEQQVLETALDINAEFTRARDLIEAGQDHVFLTGKAGTGKSTFLQWFRENTARDIVVLAPTGVAAVNIGGQTIHSFFNFRPDITPSKVGTVNISPRQKKTCAKLQTIVIDEVSMVRCDLMDCVDRFLRLHGPQPDVPFGGVQMVFIGDLYQLSPVVLSQEKSVFEKFYPSPYFFDAKVFAGLELSMVEFVKNYRQSQDHFIDLLNAVRNNELEQSHLDALNERSRAEDTARGEEYRVHLTTTNKLADQINYHHLHEINDELFIAEGEISGDFDRKCLPTAQSLELKVGAQVILLNNDNYRRWVNGSIGKVVDLWREGRRMGIQVELPGRQRVEIEPHTWDLFHYYYDEKTSRIASKVVGSFIQYPVRLAWALTIHKSQGKTFDRVTIDLGKGTFCHGQLYVALSRCRTLEGLCLKRPVVRQDVIMDKRVAGFQVALKRRLAQKAYSLEEKQQVIEEAINGGRDLKIIYLKDDNEEYERVITPRLIRSVHYRGETCQGVEAFCHDRQAHFIFRLNCILFLEPVPNG